MIRITIVREGIVIFNRMFRKRYWKLICIKMGFRRGWLRYIIRRSSLITTSASIKHPKWTENSSTTYAAWNTPTKTIPTSKTPTAPNHPTYSKNFHEKSCHLSKIAEERHKSIVKIWAVGKEANIRILRVINTLKKKYYQNK